jgi:hypothetical protein
MTRQLEILILIILSSLPFVSFGQSNSDYETEEIKAINQFLFKIIDGERLSAINKTDKPLLVYFQTKLECNLDKEASLKGEYKSNRLLRNIENNKLGTRIIDSTKIEKIDRIEIKFENIRNFATEENDLEQVIGTVSISRISFNKSLKKGFFYYNIYCGEDCGWGALVKIQKKNGVWEIIDYLSSWTS